MAALSTRGKTYEAYELLDQHAKYLLSRTVVCPNKVSGHSSGESTFDDWCIRIGTDVDLVVLQPVSKLAECYPSDRGCASFAQEGGGHTKGHAVGGAVVNDDHMLVFQPPALLVKRVEMKCQDLFGGIAAITPPPFDRLDEAACRMNKGSSRLANRTRDTVVRSLCVKSLSTSLSSLSLLDDG